MADAPQLAPPGIEVIQEFVTATPTILVPAMPACIVGPANQVVEAVQDDGSLNGDAAVNTPAALLASPIGSPYQYGTLDTMVLELSVNDGVPVQVTFDGATLLIDKVADQIREAAIPGLVVEIVEDSSTNDKQLILRTSASGDTAKIAVGGATSTAVLTAFGFAKYQMSMGSSGYENYVSLTLNPTDFPDPRNNMVDLVVDKSSIRVFVNPGSGSVREVLRTESLLDGGTAAVSVADDGDGDNASPYVSVLNKNFHVAAAALTGNIDITSTFGSFLTGTMQLNVDGVAHNVTFANPANAAAVVSQINAAVGASVASLNGSNYLVLTSTITGPDSEVFVYATSLAPSVLGLSAGNIAHGTPSRAFAHGIADLSAVVWATTVQGRALKMSVNGKPWQSVVIPTSVVSAATLNSFLESLWDLDAAEDGANKLLLRATDDFGGRESEIRIDKTVTDATLLTTLGLTGTNAPFNSVDVVRGSAFAPMVGDEFWADGVRLGVITEIPVSPTNRLRLDTERVLTYTASSWLIVAKGLDNGIATATRPSSDLIVNPYTGRTLVKQEFFYSTNGTPPKAKGLATYMAYNALRKDVSPAKDDGNFNLVRIGSLSTLSDQLGPVDTQNPLALGMYFALLNAPGIEVTGCGVDETTESAPDGTVDGYARAFEFLESKSVYAIAPMTHSSEVGSIAKLHADVLSAPESGLERIVILNPSRPTRKTNTIVASGATGNVAGAPSDVVSTGIATLQSLLAAAGVPGPTYTEADAVFLEFESDSNKYLVESISGGDVTINNGPLTNLDGFFYDGGGSAVFASNVIDRPFSIKIRGAALSNLTDEAAAYADIGRAYADRRVLVTAPDTGRATLDGLETSLEGYYLAAGLAGRKSSKEPAQPLTEDILAGFSGVVGSAERYSETQLRIMSGGGLWIFYTEEGQTLVRTRQQLTSDVSTLLNRESSITDALDYAAKLLRGTFRNFIGRYNITTGILDALNMVFSGVADFLIQNSVFKEFNIAEIVQDTNQHDKIDAIVEVVTLKPFNKLRITMRVS